MKLRALVCCAVMFVTVVSVAQQAKLTPEEVVARHLAAVGTPEARAAAKSRTASAKAQFDSIVGRSGHADGQGMMVSKGRQLSIAMRFPGTGYPDEQFVFDGLKAQISLVAPGQRSALGEFFYRHDELLREGLFGGALTTAWPLLDQAGRQPRLKYQGIAKVDGREAHDLIYLPKKRGDEDLIIHLYFDAESFRHVKSVYTFSVERSFSHKQTEHGEDRKYRVEETFSDFRNVDGLTLPGRWKVQYTVEFETSTSMAWECAVSAFAHNNVVD